MSLYEKAHLFVSAVRILEYRSNRIPASINEIAEFLTISSEEVLHIARQLENFFIINIIEKNSIFKIIVKDHIAIEKISKEKTASKLDKSLEEFKEKQKNKSKEIEEFRKEQKQKQEELFKKLDMKLKNHE